MILTMHLLIKFLLCVLHCIYHQVLFLNDNGNQPLQYLNLKFYILQLLEQNHFPFGFRVIPTQIYNGTIRWNRQDCHRRSFILPQVLHINSKFYLYGNYYKVRSLQLSQLVRWGELFAQRNYQEKVSVGQRNKYHKEYVLYICLLVSSIQNCRNL